MTKHHIICRHCCCECNFQIPQINEKENYKQIKTYFVFYLFKIHSTILSHQVIPPGLSNSARLTSHNKLVLRMIKCVFHKQKLKVIDTQLSCTSKKKTLKRKQYYTVLSLTYINKVIKFKSSFHQCNDQSQHFNDG